MNTNPIQSSICGVIGIWIVEGGRILDDFELTFVAPVDFDFALDRLEGLVMDVVLIVDEAGNAVLEQVVEVEVVQGTSDGEWRVEDVMNGKGKRDDVEGVVKLRSEEGEVEE